MAHRDLALRIGARVVRAGLTLPDADLDLLAAYLELLARWNQRINLTAFALTPASDEALDRLLVEPLAAARRVLPTDRLLVDVGSGGGSPAIPLRIAAPWLQVVLVESKARKCAFLREAVRRLGLPEVEVENRRAAELLSRPDLRKAADLVTIRAVRADAALWVAAQGLLKRGGRVFWFTTPSALSDGKMPATLSIDTTEVLIPTLHGELAVIVNAS